MYLVAVSCLIPQHRLNALLYVLIFSGVFFQFSVEVFLPDFYAFVFRQLFLVLTYDLLQPLVIGHEIPETLTIVFNGIHEFLLVSYLQLLIPNLAFRFLFKFVNVLQSFLFVLDFLVHCVYKFRDNAFLIFVKNFLHELFEFKCSHVALNLFLDSLLALRV